MKIEYYSFKKIILCFSITLLLIGLITGLLSLLSLSPVYFNNKDYYGFKGFSISILFSIFMSIVFSFLSFLVLNLGAFLYNKIFFRSK